ncbi:DMT family transporter [Rhizomicrobium electricum]|nr:DMT family transporter [Rhizomicrobium electricum]NIJ46728.1 drug/metabolite transporter (DMT)-like permease [Rhizomicrobium electricum]
MFKHSHISWPGVPLALSSAVLFGASTPFAKLLLGNGIGPWLLAGLLYLGSGIGLGLYGSLRRSAGPVSTEAPLRRADIPWLALVILCGGVAGPLLLMLGLTRTPASSAALLLNLEGLATMAIAWVVFRENVDRRLLVGAAAILAGAVVLSWSGGVQPVGWGALFIAGACVAWGIDNNLTRKLSGSDPVQIAAVKGLVAGTVNFALAVASGASLPAVLPLAGAAMIGLLGYGVSLVLFVLALRHLGSARTGAYFSMAPFIGAALAVGMLAEPVSLRLGIAAVLMGIGLWLHLTERHDHEHTHEEMEHEHRHVHDAHHQHAHTDADPPGEPHTHRHKHAPLVHTHPHYPDLHHRHNHGLDSDGHTDTK